MKVSQYRYKKDQLMLQIRSLEPVVEMLRSENMGVQVANVRNSLHFFLPGRANEWVRNRLGRNVSEERWEGTDEKL